VGLNPRRKASLGRWQQGKKKDKDKTK